MSDSPIKLLVMDLDGTLLPHGGAISGRTIAAIRAARERGVITTISSGRNIPSFIEYARTAGVNGPLIGMQGAIARELPAHGEIGSGALLRHVPFTSTLAARAVEWCRENDLWGHAVIQDDYAFDATDPHYETYQGWLAGNSVERLHSIMDLAHHLRQKNDQISKIVAHAPAGDVGLEVVLDRRDGRRRLGHLIGDELGELLESARPRVASCSRPAPTAWTTSAPSLPTHRKRCYPVAGC